MSCLTGYTGTIRYGEAFTVSVGYSYEPVRFILSHLLRNNNLNRCVISKMLTEILCTLGTCSLFLYCVGAHQVVSACVIDKYQKWKQVSVLSATQRTNRFAVAWMTLQMISSAVYISFIQYMNSTVTLVGRQTYIVAYVVAGKPYKMVVRPMRGASRVLQVSDEESRDITSYVLPFMGPAYDWHGMLLTPQFFHVQSLTFEFGNGREVTCSGTDTRIPCLVEMEN
jgi:hypothetical protein